MERNFRSTANLHSRDVIIGTAYLPQRTPASTSTQTFNTTAEYLHMSVKLQDTIPWYSETAPVWTVVVLGSMVLVMFVLLVSTRVKKLV